MPLDPKNPSKLKLSFTEPEKKNWVAIIGFWAFVAVALAGIVLMILKDPKQGALVCRGAAQTSITGFGSCVEEKP